MRDTEYVRMIEENTIAVLVSLGAHASVVRYTALGHVYEVLVGNEEFEHIERVARGED